MVDLQPSSTGPMLTGREREVAKLAGEGLSRKAIAAELGIALDTVDTHMKNLAEKVPGNGRRQVRIALFALQALSTGG